MRRSLALLLLLGTAGAAHAQVSGPGVLPGARPFTGGALTTPTTITSPQTTSTELILINAAGQTANAMEVRSSGGTPYFTIGPDVLSGASTTSNFLNVTGTFPDTTTAIVHGISFQLTSAGSSSNAQRGFIVALMPGYTGSSATTAGRFSNSAAGTGALSLSGGAANRGSEAVVTGTTAGHNNSFLASASGSSTLNVGSVNLATSSSNSPVANVGAFGMATGGSSVNAGGYFALGSAAPTLGTVTAALVADNVGVAGDIFVARDNGAAVLTIADGGAVSATGVITAASGTATPAGGSTSARLLFGTTSGFGIYYGSGAPTVTAAQGSLYLRSDGSSTSTRLYVNTDGGTTWTNFTSGS